MSSTSDESARGDSPVDLQAAFERGRARFLEGVAAFEAGRFDAAEAAFVASLAAVPGRASTLGNLGAARLKLGKPAEALDALTAAVGADPADAEAWSQKGLAHVALGDPQAALESHARAIAARGAASAHDAFGRGNALALLGRGDEAIAAYDEALALQPDLAEAWSRRGSLLREAGRLDEAAAAWQQALAHGADRDLHAYYLAGIGRLDTAVPARSPRSYVEGLFDEYAPSFGGHLVQALGYRAHARLVDGLDALAPATAALLRRHDGLDLGCGSGLCAPGLAPRVQALDGVDLSARMLAEARRLGLYRDLVHDDLEHALATTDRRYGLVAAADVFIYVGELDATFAAVRRVLVPGGVFCFSVESPDDAAAAAPLLQPSLRYQHGAALVDALAARHGYALLRAFDAPLREEQRRTVRGRYVYLGG